MNAPEHTPGKCEQCQAPLSANAPEGLCPRCLLKLNLATQTDVSDEAGPHGTHVVKSAPARPPAPDEIARYFPQLEILECLGRGGMGVVYKARQPKLNRLICLKILAPEKEKEPKFAERFLREAQALARLNHPNIVTVYDFGETDGLFYLLMEYVDGVSLRQLIRESRMTPEQALTIVPKICEALQFAHEQGVVHRDIKPENVLVDRRGQVKIADFGIAKIVSGLAQRELSPPSDTLSSTEGAEGRREEATNLTQEQVLGTPQYMAPEQKERPQRVDHRADIYSLGVVFYELLTGQLPGKAIEPPSQKVQIDVRLDQVVLRALEKEPERRYQQASEVKSDVETIAATPDAGPAARNPPQSSHRPPEPPRDYPGFTADSVRTQFVVMAVAWWIGMPLSIASDFVPPLGFIALPALVVAVVFWCILLYRHWSLLQGHGARTTPGKAVGFGFIPVYCFYWWFVAYVGLATDTGRYLNRAGITSARMSRPFAMAATIAGILACTVGLIPVAGAIFWVVYMVLAFIPAVQQKHCVLAILQHRGGHAPAATSPTNAGSATATPPPRTEEKQRNEPMPKALWITLTVLGITTIATLATLFLETPVPPLAIVADVGFKSLLLLGLWSRVRLAYVGTIVTALLSLSLMLSVEPPFALLGLGIVAITVVSLIWCTRWFFPLGMGSLRRGAWLSATVILSIAALVGVAVLAPMWRHTASYDRSRIPAIEQKLRQELETRLRAADFEAASVSVNIDPANLAFAECSFSGMVQFWGPRPADPSVQRLYSDAFGGGRFRHRGQGLWSFAGTGSLQALRFNVDASAEMRLPHQVSRLLDHHVEISPRTVVQVEQILKTEIERRLSEAHFRPEVISVSVSPSLDTAECRIGSLVKEDGGLIEHVSGSLQLHRIRDGLWTVEGSGALAAMKFSIHADPPDPLIQHVNEVFQLNEAPQATPSSSDSFGPEVSLFLAGEGDGNPRYVDFETGKRFIASEAFKTGFELFAPETQEWLRTNGIDASGGLEAVHGLVGFDLIAVPLKNEQWNTMDPERLDGYFSDYISLSKPGTAIMPAPTGMVRLFAIKTREGGRGVLQIAETTTNASGFNLRFKMITNKQETGGN